MCNEGVQEASGSSVLMEKEEQNWDQELEEDEKEEDSLKIRRSRARHEDSPIGSAAAEEDSTQLDSSGCKTNGLVVHPSEPVTDNVVDESVLGQSDEKEDPENVVSLSDNGVHKETEITEGHSKANNCVYHDKDEGIWKCQICRWTYGSSSLSIDLIQNPNGHLHELMYYKTLNPGRPSFNFEIEEHIKKNHGDDALGITTANVGAEKNLNSVIDYQHEGIQKNVNLSNPRHSEILPEECTTSYNSSKITEIKTADIDLVDESDVEGAELDVERVLQKQNTHDLYCPNCNSCITRRVILRKRKRQVRVTSEDVKRNKLETITDSTAKDSYSQATSDQGHGTGDIHLDGTSVLAANDFEREREPDIFRCLSCFSIFIPTGKGFKLFQIFGDKGKKNTMEDQQISSSFLSDKDRITAGIGSDLKGDTQRTSSREHNPSSNLNDLNRTAEVHGDGDKDLPSSAQQQLKHEKVTPSAGNISYDAKTTKKDAGDNAKNNFEVASGNQPNTSNVSEEVAYFQGDRSVAASTNRTPASKGESEKDSISVYQPDGLKLLISASVGSTTQEKLQKDQKPDLKVQNIGADMESILSMRPKASEHKEVDMNGNTPSPVEIFHEHEQHVGAMVPNLSAYENGTQDKLSNNDGASSYKLPQQTIEGNKVKIHAGEQLKINKDALVLSMKEPILIQDKQADTVKDLKKVTIEHSAEKDTVIVVEAGPSKTAASQLLQDSNASAELGTSPHLATDIDVVERMGADAGEAYEIEIIKSIVYGGLVESITSLGVVSSAAGGGTATLNILALAVANLIGGLVLVGHNLWELKKYHVEEVPNPATDRYKELLGRRENFVVHATVAVLSFIVFGLISPITYGFSFQKSDDRDFKLLAAAAASLLCIVLLATGKAYVRKPPKSYFQTVGFYAVMGFTVSGISYAAGELIKRLLDKFHVLQSNSPVAIAFTQTRTRPDSSPWASY